MALAAFILFVLALLISLIGLLLRPAPPSAPNPYFGHVALVLVSIAGALITYGAWTSTVH